MGIDKALQLDQELRKLTKEASEMLGVARQNGDKEIEIERNGTIKVKERDLWDEIWNGAKTNAREVMSNLYPEVFKKSEEAEAKKAEFLAYCSKELDLNPEQLSFSDLVKLIRLVK